MSRQEYEIRSVDIPAEVFANKNLDKTCCVLFCLIRGLDSTEEHCWASNKYFANILDLTETSISTSISFLIKEGYIQQISFDGRRRIIRIAPDYEEKHKQEKIDINNRHRDFDEEEKRRKIEKINNSINDIDELSLPLSTVKGSIKQDLMYNNKSKLIKDNKQSLLLSEDNNCVLEKRIQEDPFSSYSSFAKDLFEFWNSLPNLPTHRTNSDKFKRIMRMLERQINRFESNKIPIDDIFNAMSRYNKMFDLNKNKQSDYRISCGKKKMLGHHVGLEEFFGFADWTINNVKLKNNNPCIENLIMQGRSWFDECCRGQKYLLETYGIEKTRVYKIDTKPSITKEEIINYSYITKRIREEWIQRDFNDQLKDKDEENFAIAAKVFLKFNKINGNKITWTGTCGNIAAQAAWIVEALDHARKQYSADTSWLYSQKTYDETLPQYIKSEDLLRGNLIPYKEWINQELRI